MTDLDIIGAVVLLAISAASLVISILQFLQKGFVFNENAEQNYKDMLTAIFASPSLDSIPKDLSNLLTGVMSTAARSVTERKYETLGKMLADGLKRNNEIMRAQKTFTPEFYACGKLTANLLNVMTKLEPLKAAVEKNLGENDLQVARACKGVYEVLADGITAYNNLEARFNMDDDARAFSESRSVNDKGILDEMARLSHMYGMEALFVNGHLTLDANCDYGKIPGYGGKTSEALRQTQTIDNFVESLKGKTQEERLAIIKNPHEMTALFQNSLTAASNVIDQAIQPVPQINKDLQQQEPEIPPAQIGSPNSLG